MESETKKAVRIMAYQNMASYRVPSSLAIKESYPLPPYSSVIGMVHAACGFQSYVPMQVSIQGKCKSHVSELYTRYEFGQYTKYEAGRHQIQLKNGDDTLGMNRGVASIELLVDVYLILHIIPEDEAMIPVIAEGMLHPKNYLSLGRHEDLIRIDAVDICELAWTELEDSMVVPWDAYIPVEERNRLGFASPATIYKLHKNYTIDPNLQIRLWNSVRAQFVKGGAASEIEEESMVWVDLTPMPEHINQKEYNLTSPMPVFGA